MQQSIKGRLFEAETLFSGLIQPLTDIIGQGQWHDFENNGHFSKAYTVHR